MKEIRFVDVGEGITEGHLQKRLVGDGDKVKEDQGIVQVETDKAIVSVPAPIDGIVKIVAREGADLHVGDTIAYIGTSQELAGIQKQQVQQTAPKGAQAAAERPVQAQAQTAAQPEILATPSLRKLAHDLGVDLTQVRGTGPAGRILENDVRAFVGKAPQQKAVPKFSELLEEQHEEDIERIPMSQTRKAIAKNMEASLAIPSAAHMDLIDAQALFDVMLNEKDSFQAKFGVKLTYLPFIIKATVEALKENPNFNASYDHERLEIIRKNYYNIGLAAEAPDGLKVVVIKDADKKSIVDIAREIQQLHQKLQDQTITIEEMRDNTFTITNTGSLGGGFLSVPIINHPDVAILGTHLIRDMPVVKEGRAVVGKVLPVSIVFDHRVVDGAEAVKFCNDFRKYIENVDFLKKTGLE
jgi:pyruvate dehydrogenase E2 component (dihydrolipoamide acetyltransferase)